jgi:outer membrane usher protein FimD/PapC
VLPERGGAVIRFEARPLRALSAQLVTRSGHETQPLPLARVRMGEGLNALETFTGLHGELYLEDLAPGLHEGLAQSESGPCNFRLAIPHTREVLTELGVLECTPLAPTQNRSDGPR